MNQPAYYESKCIACTDHAHRIQYVRVAKPWLAASSSYPQNILKLKTHSLEEC